MLIGSSQVPYIVSLVWKASQINLTFSEILVMAKSERD